MSEIKECPTCGGRVTVEGDEGTYFYRPVDSTIGYLTYLAERGILSIATEPNKIKIFVDGVLVAIINDSWDVNVFSGDDLQVITNADATTEILALPANEVKKGDEILHEGRFQLVTTIVPSEAYEKILKFYTEDGEELDVYFSDSLICVRRSKNKP